MMAVFSNLFFPLLMLIERGTSATNNMKNAEVISQLLIDKSVDSIFISPHQ